MPRTAQIAIFGWDRLSRRGGELRNATARQLLPALGIALMRRERAAAAWRC